MTSIWKTYLLRIKKTLLKKSWASPPTTPESTFLQTLKRTWRRRTPNRRRSSSPPLTPLISSSWSSSIIKSGSPPPPMVTKIFGTTISNKCKWTTNKLSNQGYSSSKENQCTSTTPTSRWWIRIGRCSNRGKAKFAKRLSNSRGKSTQSSRATLRISAQILIKTLSKMWNLTSI